MERGSFKIIDKDPRWILLSVLTIGWISGSI